MGRVSGLVLMLAAAALVAGVSAAEKGHKWTGMKIDWGTSHTKEELETGAFMNPLSSSRIINGDIVWKEKKAPYVGSLYVIQGNRWVFVCTCAIVDTYIVMTAAHCTFVEEGFDMGVCVSGVEVDEGRCIRVKRTKVPKIYFRSDLGGFGEIPWTHDLALMRTKKKLVQSSSTAKVIPVDLANSSIGGRGANGYIYGYGASNSAATRNDGKLRVVDIYWKKFRLCSSDPYISGRNFLCSDGNYDGSKGGSCYGDSGGPMIWSSDGSSNPAKHVLVGISSFVYSDPALGYYTCDVKTPSGYSRLASDSQTKWLKRSMKKLNGMFTVYRP